jgi:hypothetical protein
MLDGVMLLWWILTIPSFLFVIIDVWRTTPESAVLKWAFAILTAFTGPLGAFFYVLGLANRLAAATNNMSRSVGAKCSGRRCTVSPATG